MKNWNRDIIYTCCKESKFWLYSAVVALYKVSFDDDINWGVRSGISDKYYGFTEDEIDELSEIINDILLWYKHGRDKKLNIHYMWDRRFIDMIANHIDDLVDIANKKIQIPEEIELFA